MSSLRKPPQPDETLGTPKNGEMLNSDNPNVTPNHYYHNRDVAHAAEVKYENNRYITSVNVEFGSTESDSTVNIAPKYRKLFTAIKILDSSTKFITDDDTVIHHPKEFPMGADYATKFTVINDCKARFLRVFVRHVIDSTRTVSSMKYGDDNIITTLQKNKTWIAQDKYNTHREASIEFIKYISTAFTLQQVTKARVVNALMNLELTIEEIFTLSIIPEDAMVTSNTVSKKRCTDGQPKVPEEDINNQIIFLAFDLSTKKVGFGNSPDRVTTIAYEIKCHPNHSALLKVLLTRASILDKNPQTIHFILYGLINVSDSNTVKHQIIQQNQFIHNTTIMPIHNIDEDTMYSGFKENLENIPSVTNIEKHISHLLQENGS